MGQENRPFARQGKQLERARGARPAQEAADFFGLSYQAIQQWERGITRPDSRKWPKVRAFYGLDPAVLYGGGDDGSLPDAETLALATRLLRMKNDERADRRAFFDFILMFADYGPERRTR
jgi:transcriptional regulator with XRE-family HTH domain